MKWDLRIYGVGVLGIAWCCAIVAFVLGKVWQFPTWTSNDEVLVFQTVPMLAPYIVLVLSTAWGVLLQGRWTYLICLTSCWATLCVSLVVPCLNYPFGEVLSFVLHVHFLLLEVVALVSASIGFAVLSISTPDVVAPKLSLFTYV